MLTAQEKTEFGRYLRSLREAAGKSLRDVQRECKISPGYLSLVESGDRNPPSDEFLKKLAHYYGESPGNVLRRAGRLEVLDEGDLELDRLRRAYEFVISDKRFRSGNRLTGEPDREMMLFVVEMYQRLTNLNLLNEQPGGKTDAEECE